jgi:hypothetical protein
MAKLSKAERQAWEKDLATLRAAVAQCEQVLKADDEAAKAVAAEGDAAVVKKIVDGGTGDARTATTRGVFAIREQGGHRISDAVYGGDREK